MNKPINVTKTFLPPIEEYEKYVEQIWKSDWLTNQGPLLQELETELRKYLGAKYLHIVTNGTLALQIAIKALDIEKGSDIITTPFSYVATTSSILWEGYNPVYVDIEPDTFCIDPTKIEAAITPKTKAIMPVHVFGNACDLKMIDEIAKKHNLKVIYDAAHAFGVKVNNQSLLNMGDISMCSFHATKLFHTIEGGCVITQNKEISDRLDLIKRFGHNGDEHLDLGINAKATEFQAAMGLCNLKYVNTNIKKRRERFKRYNQQLSSTVRLPIIRSDIEYNYAYYPILLKDETLLKQTVKLLNEASIFPRRYFYPSLNTLPYLTNRQECPISEDISKRILCLPLYTDLELEDIDRISRIINDI